MRHVLIVLVVAALAATLVPAPTQAQGAVRVFVDGQLVQFDQPPIVVAGMRVIFLSGMTPVVSGLVVSSFMLASLSCRHFHPNPSLPMDTAVATQFEVTSVQSSRSSNMRSSSIRYIPSPLRSGRSTAM